MTFLSVLIALVIERFFHWNHFRRWRWFSIYQHRLTDMGLGRMPAYLWLLLVIVPPVLIVGIVSWLLSGRLYGMPELLFGIVIFLYCLGPENFWLDVAKLANAKTTVFVEAYRRILAILFWFILLGPSGAVLYRVIDLLASESMAARRVQQVLDWIPIRIFTFIFALGGHFTEVLARWKIGVSKGVLANETMLTDCGMAALDLEMTGDISEVANLQKQVVELMDRVLVISLVVLAVIVLLG